MALATDNRAPGTYKSTTTASPAGPSGPETGTAFKAGITLRGPTDTAVLIDGIGSFVRNFGGRISGSALYDAVDLHCLEGGGPMYVARNIGASAATATGALTGTSGTTLSVAAANPGTWGNDLTYDVVPSGGSYVIILYHLGIEVERSTSLTTRDEAPDYFEDSLYARFTIGAGSGDPVAVTGGALSGGTNGTTSSVTRQAALDLFTEDLGPGQLSVDGDTSSACHVALIAKATADGVSTDRIALCEHADADAATTVAAIEALQAEPGADRAVQLVSVGTAPGGAGGSTRQVPYGAVFSAHCARLDRVKAPGHAIAGDDSVCSYVSGLVREFTTAERKLLNDAGATVAILRRPDSRGVRRVGTFSDRTSSDRTDESKVHEASDARVLMAVQSRIEFAMGPYAFAQLTADKKAEITGVLTPICSDLYAEGVISDGTEDGSGTYADAFSVDVLMDKPNRTWIVNAYPRPSRCGEVQQINVIRQLEV